MRWFGNGVKGAELVTPDTEAGNRPSVRLFVCPPCVVPGVVAGKDIMGDVVYHRVSGQCIRRSSRCLVDGFASD